MITKDGGRISHPIGALHKMASQALRVTVAIFAMLISDAKGATQVITWGVIPATPPTATNVVALAAGDSHVVALRADGTVVAWGQNTLGQTTVPSDITNAVRITAGSSHSLALLDDGTIRFWGKIYSTGVTNIPVGADNSIIELAQGPTAQHVFSLRSDGGPMEWGNSSYGLPSVPAKATNLVDSAVASYHTVALRADGTAVVWGQYYPAGTASAPASATNLVAVAASFTRDLGIRADGSLFGWSGATVDNQIPPVATNITAIAGGGSQWLALRADGQVISWPAGNQNTNALPSILSNAVAIACSTSGNLALSASDGHPLLGRMPRNAVAAGLTARFKPLVVSTTPVTYQWMSNGTNIPGATSQSLILTNVQINQAGNYVLVASNAFGSVTNSDLVLNVQPILIQSQPQNLTVAGGTTNGFSVAAFGQGPLAYQWQFFGTNLTGLTKSSLSLTNIQLGQAGPYSVVISNSYGSVTSTVASLTVIPFFLTSQPTNQTIYSGATATFGVTMVGKGPYTFQWKFGGTNLFGASTNPLVLASAQLSDAGLYSVVVSNAFGGLESTNAILSIVPILVSAEPKDQATFLGQTVTFTVTAGASVPLSYRWLFNGTNLPGAAASTLILTNCQYGQSGVYQAFISDSSNETSSTVANFIVDQVASWGSQSQLAVPAGISNLIAISARGSQAIALRKDATVTTWGNYLGVPSVATNVIGIAAGSSHYLILKGDGSLLAWGINSSGVTNIPSGLANISALASGAYHNLVLDGNGTVHAWGSNGNGQTNVPPGLSNVIAIAAGGFHSMALRADGTVVCWGDSSGVTNVPAGLSNVVAIAGGDIISLALTSDGKVTEWGNTGYGGVPADATNVVAISAGYGHALALKEDGTVLAWGYYYEGETVVPTNLNHVIAIAAGSSHSLAVVFDETPGDRALLASPALTPTGFSVSVPTRSGRVYRLEFKESVDDLSWTPLPLVAGTGSRLTLTDPSAPGARRFYRVRGW